MGETDERQISAEMTFFWKFAYPLFFFAMLLAVSLSVAFLGGKKSGPPSPATGCIIGLVGLGAGLCFFVPYIFPLKQVWFIDHGLRISNFRVSVAVPFGTIEDVVQKADNKLRCVVVTLNADTPFGRRFTFLPPNPTRPWPFSSRGDDQVVIELRNRVEAARMEGKPPPRPGAGPGRSPMADAELDGPI